MTVAPHLFWCGDHIAFISVCSGDHNLGDCAHEYGRPPSPPALSPTPTTPVSTSYALEPNTGNRQVAEFGFRV